VLLVANDGFSAGHVMRSLAIARGLRRVAATRGVEVALTLATTSRAFGLLADEPLALVTLPPPAAARRAGLSDAARRRMVRATLAGVVDGFGPDLLVVDTFPSGPHGELAGLRTSARRVLVRRSVPEVGDPEVVEGLAGYHLAILAGDPQPLEAALPVPTCAVPPITLGEPGDALDRDAARAALGVDGRVIVVMAGGGGDRDAVARARRIAEAIVRVDQRARVALATGPLAEPARLDAPRIVPIARAPLQPLFAAFDGAFAPAGYNTAHELAKAGVPAALYAQPRPYDDQAARAARFPAAGFARVLDDVGDAALDDAVREALAWMASARLPRLPSGGADAAATALLELVMRGGEA